MLPADILGQVYEQFLGKVIRLTAGHHAMVEEKPEVSKAGGVFYTPTYIVESLCGAPWGRCWRARRCVRWPAGARPTPPLRIADIACGSGSFLLGVYQFLLDWYLAPYVAHLTPLLLADTWPHQRSPRLVPDIEPATAGEVGA